MTEVTFAGEHHGHAVVVGGIDHFLVTYGPAGLDDRGGAGLGGGIETIAEREERVARAGPALRTTRSLLGGDATRVAAVLLPGTDAALALALMHELITHGWLDHDYIARHTLGWEELKARALQWERPLKRAPR